MSGFPHSKAEQNSTMRGLTRPKSRVVLWKLVTGAAHNKTRYQTPRKVHVVKYNPPSPPLPPASSSSSYK